MKHFNRNRPLSYTRCSTYVFHSQLLREQYYHAKSCIRIAHVNILMPSSFGSLNIPISLWHIYFVSHKKISYFLVSLKTLSFIHHCSLFEYSIILCWFVLFVDFKIFFTGHLLLQLCNIITANPWYIIFKGLVWSRHLHLTILYCPTYRLAREYALTMHLWFL